MGCDIHMKVQAKRGDDWKTVNPPKDLDWHGEFERKYKCWYSDRNYDAFAILADVRNGRGFAGVETGEALIPVVAKRRGLPKGVKNEDWEYGDHSFHWLLLSELLSYPHWDKRRTVCGLVETTEIENEPSLNTPPKSYCDDAWGPQIKKIDEAKWIELGKPRAQHLYVQFQWPETYAFSAGQLYTNLIPALRTWADKNKVPYERVRLVMGFDS